VCLRVCVCVSCNSFMLYSVSSSANAEDDVGDVVIDDT